MKAGESRLTAMPYEQHVNKVVPRAYRPQTERGRGHVIAMLSCIPI